MRLLIRIKEKLSLITPFLLINFKSKSLKSVKKVGKEAIQLMKSIPSR